MCGCALTSVGAPCVAHRVWPRPVLPRNASPSPPAANARSRSAMRPTLRVRRNLDSTAAPGSMTATPAES